MYYYLLGRSTPAGIAAWCLCAKTLLVPTWASGAATRWQHVAIHFCGPSTWPELQANHFFQPTGGSFLSIRHLQYPVAITELVRTFAMALHPAVTKDTLPEWPKGVDSSSTSAICVGSNPTAVRQAWGMQLHASRSCKHMRTSGRMGRSAACAVSSAFSARHQRQFARVVQGAGLKFH